LTRAISGFTACHNVCLFRPLLFRLEAERARALTLNALRVLQRIPLALWLLEPIYKSPPKPVTVFGLTFKNPVGSAGGIMSPDDVKRRLDIGAALVQVYTGLV
jgi:hypothetical protein